MTWLVCGYWTSLRTELWSRLGLITRYNMRWIDTVTDDTIFTEDKPWSLPIRLW